jgi:hypothetical protein
MSEGIPEADWKVFRKLREIALERFCERVLAEVSAAAVRPGARYHERYLDVFDILKKRDRELAYAFNNPRRSQAILQLLCIHSHGLLTDDELAGFSEGTCELTRRFARDDEPGSDPTVST